MNKNYLGGMKCPQCGALLRSDLLELYKFWNRSDPLLSELFYPILVASQDIESTLTMLVNLQKKR